MTRGAHACPAELELVSPGSEKWLNRLDTALQEGQVTGPAFCRDRGWEGRQLPLAPPPRGSDSPFCIPWSRCPWAARLFRVEHCPRGRCCAFETQ